MKTLKKSVIGSGFRLNKSEIEAQKYERENRTISHGGTLQFRKRVAKRRKANKVAKQSRKTNHF